MITSAVEERAAASGEVHTNVNQLSMVASSIRGDINEEDSLVQDCRPQPAG